MPTYLELVVVELPSGSVTFPQVRLGPDTRRNQFPLQLGTSVVNSLVLALGLGQTNWDDSNLLQSNPGREDQTLIITVDHDHNTDRSCRKTPRILVDKRLFLFSRSSLVGMLDGNVEHLGEVLSEMMGCSSLNTSTGGWNEPLDGGSVISSGEFLLDRLDTRNNGNGEEVNVDSSVEI